MHAVEPLVPESTPSDFEVTTKKLKSHKSRNTEKITAELI
jgi:hypothetical protein